MRVFLLLLSLVACAGPPNIEPVDVPVQRLIRDTLQVDHAKAGIEMIKKERLTDQQARELHLLASIADEAMQSARDSYFAGDLPAFERSMVTVGKLLHEFRGRIVSIESERQQAAADSKQAAEESARSNRKRGD